MPSNVLTLDKLFATCQADFPSSLPPESWYLVTASALITVGDPSNLGALYNYVTDPLPQAERRIVNRRFREFGLKQWVTIGIPKVAVAMFSLGAAAQPGDTEFNPPKKFRTLDPSIRDHSDSYLAAVYTSKVVYGLFYSDDSVLDYLETELITYTAIACQQPVMALPMANHLNSLRRMGLDREQCEGVTRVATRVAKWIGVDTKEWKQVGDVVDWTKRV